MLPAFAAATTPLISAQIAKALFWNQAAGPAYICVPKGGK